MSSQHKPGVRPPKRPPPPEVNPRSLVLVNTGDGKGKSTAAFGIVMRGVARDWQICVIQFIKSGKWKVGEEKVARQLGVGWLKGGDGFTWESPDLDESRGRAAAWQLAVPAEHRFRLDQQRGQGEPRQPARQEGKHETIGLAPGDNLHMAFEDADLVAQHQQLGLISGAVAEGCEGEVDEDTEVA